jgi:hypothetical protein
MAQADEPVNRGGQPGSGTATNTCRTSVPPQEEDPSKALCTIKVTPGAPGPAIA